MQHRRGTPPRRVGVSIRNYRNGSNQPSAAWVVDRVRVSLFSLIVLIVGISAFTAENNAAAQTVQLPPPAASSLDRIAQASPYGYPLSPPPPAWDPYGPQASDQMGRTLTGRFSFDGISATSVIAKLPAGCHQPAPRRPRPAV